MKPATDTTHRMECATRTLALFAALALAACKPAQDGAASSASSSEDLPSIPAGVDDPSGSCNLVTAEEMSAIIGQQVQAVQRAPDGGHSACAYYSDATHDRVFELVLQPDNLGNAQRLVDEPLHHGAASADQPYADIGDQVGRAYSGRVLVVAVGNDLLNFDLNKVPGDKHTVVKRIVDAATPRMRAIAAAQPSRPRACELVTATEMSGILGKPVTAEGSEPFNNQTICTYGVADQTIVNFQVDWGDAQAAAMGIGMAEQTELGEVIDSADTLGDGYTQIGPNLMIRVGADLVTLQMMGPEDMHATAKRILDIAGPRIRAAASQG